MTTTQKNRFELIDRDDPARTEKLASYCARTAYENRAEEIEVLDISELCSYADFFVIASGQNRNQLLAVAEHTECEMEANNLFKIGSEGRKDESGWILLDYGNIIVQLFDREARHFYQLEELWADAPRLAWQTISGAPQIEDK